MNKFYTYAYLRDDGTPYYIGKGCGNRAYRKSKGIRPKKDMSNIIFLHKNCTENQALAFEIFWIAVYGRKDIGTGILHNKTAGGEGVKSASPETLAYLKKPKSDATKEKLRIANFGKKNTETAKANKRKAKELNPTWNKDKTGIYSEETIRLMSESKHRLRQMCVYCSKEFDIRNFKRWHGENCKGKKNGIL